MSETIAITGKSVKLFKGHYTRRATAPDRHRESRNDTVLRHHPRKPAACQPRSRH
ncbi:MAG: hypothetical protein ACREYE_19410 [Gammaproteobacteria bacterium]